MASVEQIVDRCKALEEDASFSIVRSWREADPSRKVIGCFPVYAPAELIAAAGMLPVGLLGAGGRVDIETADSRMQSFVCSISRSTLELGLTHRLDVFDGFVFSNICDVARNLSGVWRRNFPDRLVEYLHLPQNLASAATVDFLEASLEHLRRSLEALGGRPIPDDRIAASVRAYEEGRRLVRQLYGVRSSAPWALAAWESYLILRAGSVLPREEHNALLREALDALSARTAKPMDKVRVLLVGAFCEQPPVELLRSVEDAGCYVLDDDLLIGHRWFDGEVSSNGAPLRALAEAYVRRGSSSSVCHPATEPRPQWLLRRYRELQADGVLFCSAKFCEPALYDYVPCKEALEAAGVPYLHLEFEEKMTAFDSARTQVETFVESVLFA